MIDELQRAICALKKTHFLSLINQLHTLASCSYKQVLVFILKYLLNKNKHLFIGTARQCVQLIYQ
jgi:hypothetical protein